MSSDGHRASMINAAIDNLNFQIHAPFLKRLTRAYKICSAASQNDRIDTQCHLEFLRDSAKGNVLEIGTHAGISTAALLAGVEAKGGHVYSVDVHAGSRYTHWGHPQWTFIQSDSKNLSELSGLLPESFDFVFIDGDHSYEGCLADLENWGVKGKVIAVHDSDTPAFPGVRRAIDEFCVRMNFPHELRQGSAGLEVIHARPID